MRDDVGTRPPGATGDLAAFIAAARHTAAPTAIRDTAVAVLVDQVGLQVGCSALPWSRSASAVAHATYAPGPAVVVGEGRRLCADGAAFVNAAFGHGQDFDDTCRPVQTHSGSVVVPVALALAQELGSTGEQVLRATIAGIEVLVRVAHAIAPGCLQRGVHPMLVAGPFGAAATAAVLFELDAAATTNLLGVVGSYPGGVVQYTEFGGSVKRLHGAIPAVAGLQAARLARAGITGPAEILEGTKGVLGAYSDTAEPGRVVAGLGCDYLLSTIALKFYNCCYFIHPAIDAALALTQEHAIEPGQIAAVSIGTSAQSRRHVGSIPRPTDELGAQFSLHFCVAQALLGHVPSVDSFTAERLADPATRALAARIEVHEDPLAENEYPENWGSVVRITTHDGRTAAHRVRDPLGSPQSPASDDDIARKFRTLAGARLPAGQVDELYALARGIAALTDVDCLLAATVAPSRQLKSKRST